MENEYWNSFALQYEENLTLSDTTKYGLFQSERVPRRQFQIWWKWQKVLQTGRKHCGKRINCSLQAIYPFPSVFERLVLQTRKNQGLFGKGLRKWNLMSNHLFFLIIFYLLWSECCIWKFLSLINYISLQSYKSRTPHIHRLETRSNLVLLHDVKACHFSMLY